MPEDSYYKVKGCFCPTIPLNKIRDAINRSYGSIERLARILDITENEAKSFVLNLEWIDAQSKIESMKKYEQQYFDGSAEWYENIVWNKNYDDGFGKYVEEDKTIGMIKFPFNGKDK